MVPANPPPCTLETPASPRICGVWIGNRFGNRFEKKAEIAGGVVLILIGVKILLDHLIQHQ